MQAHQRQSAVAKAEVPARDAPELRLLAGGRTEAPYLYSTIPTIGTLFVLNFVGATLIGLALLAPSERLLGRFGRTAVDLFALGGAGLAATAFVFLYVSERDTVVRLRGAWLRPACEPGVPQYWSASSCRHRSTP